MDLFKPAIDVYDAIFTLISRGVKQNLAAYCDLECAEDDHTLVYRDGSVCSFIVIEGVKALIGNEEFSEITQAQTRALAPFMFGSGHSVQFVFTRDPDLTKRDISRAQDPARKTAKKIGLAVGDIIDERVNHLSKYTNSESCYLVLHTSPEVMSRGDAKVEAADRKETLMGLPLMTGSQDVAPAARAILARHKSFVDSFSNDLKASGILHHLLNTHDSLREIRREIDPDFTSDDWNPVLVGDRITPRMPDDQVKDSQVSGFLGAPSLSRQLFPRDARAIGQKTVRIGDRIYAPMFMDIGPQTPRSFSNLFSRVDASTPWRISFLVESGGLGAMKFKKSIASILFWASDNNKALKASLNHLTELEANGVPIVKFRASFTTWANADEPKKLVSRASSLARSLDGWGVCSSREEIGDPVAGLFSTMPALSRNSVATASAPPLNDVVSMMPLLRPASPWETGSVLFRTIDGKIWPYQPGSSKQTTWIDLIFAKPGSGKSVLMSAINQALCLKAGATRLPRITVIDIGPSASGLISMLSDALPEDRRHEVGYHRLQMTKEYAINPLDTQMGCRYPQPAERAFLKNFITLLTTPVSSSTAYEGAAELAGEVVDEVYRTFSDKGAPKKYTPHADKDVDAALEQYNIAVDSETTWWEVVDGLAEHGEMRIAAIAQRYAVPLISDCIMVARNTPSITSTYGAMKITTSESIIEAFCRMLSSAVKEYPVLSMPTRFDVSDTRILVLDLDEVAKTGGDSADRQTAVMYMLARYAAAKDYYLTPAILDTIDKRYSRFHERRVKEIQEDDKRINFDEFHKTRKAAAVREQVIIDMREGRKWGVQVCLASQSVDDFDETMLEFATNVFIMDGGQKATVDKLTQTFGLTGAAQRVLTNHVKGPTSAGAPFLLLSTTKDGMFSQLLYSTIGPKEMWSYSTTKKDVLLRGGLVKAVGSTKARDILSRYYPGGSAMKDIEDRELELFGDDYVDDDNDGVIGGLTADILKRAKTDGLLEGV